eukprot:NODE_25274_length_593_cov_2.403433.p1 GENE.NODE_25274_length_593_cov_2.403433~~NODE_25274_length_593_cov_2.403433.p1  ORF type:complete len:108 (-),score=36.25 NODE_25274_length_593_cov_2.403433:26-349(-)
MATQCGAASTTSERLSGDDSALGVTGSHGTCATCCRGGKRKRLPRLWCIVRPFRGKKKKKKKKKNNKLIKKKKNQNKKKKKKYLALQTSVKKNKENHNKITYETNQH